MCNSAMKKMQKEKSKIRMEKMMQKSKIHDYDSNPDLDEIYNPDFFMDYGFYDDYSIKRDSAVTKDLDNNISLLLRRNVYSTEPFVISHKFLNKINQRVRTHGIMMLGKDAYLL